MLGSLMRHCLILLLVLLSTGAAAQTLHTFSNGEIADAEKINETHQYLLEKASGGRDIAFQETYWGGGWESIFIDCDADPMALQNRWPEVSEARNRVSVTVSGTCTITTQLRISGQQVYLNSGDQELSACDAPATIRAESAGRFLVSNAGGLLMHCLSLDSLSDFTLHAATNSSIRTDTGVVATNDNLRIRLRAASVYRTFSTRNIKELELRSGSVAELNLLGIDGSMPPFNLEYVRLYGGSVLTCQFCGYLKGAEESVYVAGRIGSLFMTGGSIADFSLIQGDLIIDQLVALTKSMLFHSRLFGGCSALLVNPSLDSGSEILSDTSDNCVR